MNPASYSLLAALLTAALMTQPASQPPTSQTNWADCLQCHTDQYADLPQLSELRPQHGASILETSCSACHTPVELMGGRSDWRHPVRPVGSHVACTSCHPAVEHGVEHPPPLPRGDYNSAGCYACHGTVKLARAMMSAHRQEARVHCRDCHPAHQPLLAQLPAVLLPAGEREQWAGAYDWAQSNADCLRCHAPAPLLMELNRGFVTLNTLNLHDLHVTQGQVLCIECHLPHGSIQQSLLRGTLLTGQQLMHLQRIDGGSCAVSCHGVRHEDWQYINKVF